MRVQRAVLVAGLAVSFCVGAPAQTSLACSVLGAFGQSTNGNGTQQFPSIHAGGLVQLRHISNPLVGYEVTYSYNRANQVYASSPDDENVQPPVAVSANAHQVTGDWVVSARVLNIRPLRSPGLAFWLTCP